jgi:UDP-N-acetylmuramyl pentapeptide phosphotransferase/UDP-N-acetylglucosamine-1-phosphate transferase
LSTIYGKELSVLQNQQVGETVRELGLAGQNEKAGTPTMGGLIIFASGACCVVCKVAKYLRSAFDRNYFVDGDNRFYR